MRQGIDIFFSKTNQDLNVAEREILATRPRVHNMISFHAG